ncbi:unnamed protein product [Dovyalis caffra]|uniref:Uncharacterized protein n=1 Tax=Dovyalis caffra TaxID=77055 RepID=A0AAV1RQ49_9ROSI|nr:unnamed protein product [Dovyalis caffra]
MCTFNESIIKVSPNLGPVPPSVAAIFSLNYGGGTVAGRFCHWLKGFKGILELVLSHHACWTLSYAAIWLIYGYWTNLDGAKSTVTHEKKTSVLQGDNFFFNRVISRNSSAGCSSRIFYYRSAEGVPFKWEMQPGTPKDPPKEEIIPPLSPPPAVLSLGLPKPCIDIEEQKFSMRSRFKFWKHTKKNKRNKKSQQRSEGNNIKNTNDESDKLERFEFYSSDGDFMASSPRNSSFSSSSSLSFSHGHSRQLSRIESTPARDSMQEPHGCIPWDFTAVLVSVARRNI